MHLVRKKFQILTFWGSDLRSRDEMWNPKIFCKPPNHVQHLIQSLQSKYFQVKRENFINWVYWPRKYEKHSPEKIDEKADRVPQKLKFQKDPARPKKGHSKRKRRWKGT